MKAEDIVFKNIPCNFLCHTLSKINEKQVKDFKIQECISFIEK